MCLKLSMCLSALLDQARVLSLWQDQVPSEVPGSSHLSYVHLPQASQAFQRIRIRLHSLLLVWSHQ